MRYCFICLKPDVLQAMRPIFSDIETINCLNFFANITVVEFAEDLRDSGSSVLLICSTCQQMSKKSAEFKRKCLNADYINKTKFNSSNYVFSENLNNLIQFNEQSKINQEGKHCCTVQTQTVSDTRSQSTQTEIGEELKQIDDQETVTIETFFDQELDVAEVAKTSLSTNVFNILSEIPESFCKLSLSKIDFDDSLIDNLTSDQLNDLSEVIDFNYNIINHLTNEQVKELTDDISNLLETNSDEEIEIQINKRSKNKIPKHSLNNFKSNKSSI